MLTVTAVAQVAGTVYVWFGSASQVTAPLLATLMYLYWMTVPGASDIVPAHSGLADVYWDAESAIAELVSQFDKAAKLPVILMVCPKVVVTVSSKVTATLVASVQDVVVLDAAVEDAVPVPEAVVEADAVADPPSVLGV